MDKNCMDKKNNKKKKYGKIITFIIILIVLLCTAIGWALGYFYSDYFDKLFDKKDNVLEKKQIKKQDNVLTQTEVEELVSQVPLYSPSTVIDAKDAYQDGKIDINDVEASVLFSIASSKIDEDKILSYESGMPLPKGETNSSMLNEDEDGNKGSDNYVYFKSEDLKSKIKELYNFDLKEDATFVSPGNEKVVNNTSDEDIDEEDYRGQVFFYKDGYYIDEATYTKSMNKKYSNIVDYNENKDELAVTELFGISRCDEGGCYLYNKRSLDRDDAIFSCKISDSNCNEKTLNGEFINNKDKFNEYKHIFKKTSDGKYYWFSTELIK